MSFLAPLFLFGTLAVALPILFHLIRRTSRERLPFSSLMFLSPSLPKVTRRSRLENILLLLLRCLILCLLAAGFARPFFKTIGPVLPPTEAAKKIVILIDSSASMRREGLWAAARDKAEEILKGVAVSDQAAVFNFDRQVHPVVSFEQWTSQAAGERVTLTMQRLSALTPSWSATYLGNALTTAAEAFEETNKKERSFGPKQIIVISDLQEGCKLEGLQGYEWPKGIELVMEPVKAKRLTNAGLQLVAEHEETTETLVEAGPRIRISNSSDAKHEQFQVRWESLAGADPLDVYIPPGQGRIFPAPQTPPGLTGERLALRGDDEDFDNSVYFLQPKAEQINVLYLGNEPETDSAQPLYYLKRAFQQTRRQTVQIVAHRADAPLTVLETDKAPLLIVGESLSEPAFQAVQQAMVKGKTVLLALKSTSDVPTLARLAGVDSLAAEEASGQRYAMLGEIDFQHPLFVPFADPRYSDFTKIHFWKHRRVETDKLPGARILARFDNDKAPALIELTVGKGSLLVFTSSWHPGDSQLALASKFVPLLYSILEQSGALKAQRVQYVIGDEVLLTATNASRLTIRKPDGTQLELPASDKFNQTDQPGIYTVTSIQPPLRFAVNLDPLESKTAPLPLEQLERFGVPLKKQPIKESSRQIEQRRQQMLATELESRQRLWRWLVIAALTVLILETWLAAWLTRRTSVPAEEAA
jgi:hypothetical protein